MDHLKRYPVRKNELLKASDSADELILEHLQQFDLKGKRILIINDGFGALSFNLKALDIVVYTDSYLSYRAIKMNTQDEVNPIFDLNDIKGPFDVVLMKLPKNLSFLEDILCHLTKNIHSETSFIFGVMVKHQASGAFDLIEKYIGKTTTSLAKKKARLIFAKFEKDEVKSPYPLNVKLDGFVKEFSNNSNLFSREKLDIGTRFLLENMPRGDFKRVLDLGCANGVVGIKAKLLIPNAELHFSDESAMAIQSAKTNYQKHFSDEAFYHWTNCFEDGQKDSFDLVLCNPPFHQGHSIGDFIAKQMFLDAKRALKSGGILRVVGNSHLGYPGELKRIFGNSSVINKNQKFIIIDGKK